MTNDPAIDEIRRIRHAISREAGHDMHRLKKTFERLESQFDRPAVDYGRRRTSRCTGTGKLGKLPVENLSSPTGER